jgi:hypothetical protein
MARWPTGDHDIDHSTNLSNTNYSSPRTDYNPNTPTLKLRGTLLDGHGETVVAVTGVLAK